MGPPTPVAGHPRLWLTAADLPTLQSWAVSSNPVYASGFAKLLAQKLTNYDQKFFPGGKAATPFPDSGGAELIFEPVEELGAIFAFASLITSDPAKQVDYAGRARTILMYVMDQAVNGAGTGPFRDPRFSWKDRARWSGELWPLIVDWIYPYLSADDKAKIRTVFLRWASEQVDAFSTVRPVGIQNDPSLTSDRIRLRGAANNYYQAAGRNLTMEGIVFDPADDAGGMLHAAAFDEAIGGFLYQTYALFQDGDARGGVPAEGAFFYGQESISFTTMGLLALETAGLVDTAKYGPQMGLVTSDYWDKMLEFYPNAIAPAAQILTGLQYLGPVYLAAELEQTQDQFVTLGAVAQQAPIALIARRTGNTTLESRVLWFLNNVVPGGADSLAANAASSVQNAILSFLLFKPGATPASDYRPTLPTSFYSPGVRRLEARTDWTSSASWFGYVCAWKSIDHQTDICGGFHFYRKGQWITKSRTGYSNTGLLDAPDYWNAIGVQNDPINVGYQQVEFDRGGTLAHGGGGDPSTVVSTMTPYVYVQSDATNLYQSDSPAAHDVTHVGRAILWIKPDTIVTYDRATTKTAGRFKHYNLDLPSKPQVSGSSITSTTSTGQLLRIDALLPAGASISEQPWEPDTLLAEPESMVARIRIEPNTSATTPADVRFLTTLQVTDGANPAAATLITVTGSAAFHGAIVTGTAVLFPVDAAPASAAGISYVVPAGVSHGYITGLVAGAGYDVTISGTAVSVAAGTSLTADDSGVLAY